MIDRVEAFVPDGGPNGLGFLQGAKAVDPSEWFFKAHFYQDPVIPGSLGLESLLQLLKVAAVERWGGGPRTRFRAMTGRPTPGSTAARSSPHNAEVVVQAFVTEMRRSDSPFDGRRAIMGGREGRLPDDRFRSGNDRRTAYEILEASIWTRSATSCRRSW